MKVWKPFSNKIKMFLNEPFSFFFFNTYQCFRSWFIFCLALLRLLLCPKNHQRSWLAENGLCCWWEKFGIKKIDFSSSLIGTWNWTIYARRGFRALIYFVENFTETCFQFGRPSRHEYCYFSNFNGKLLSKSLNFISCSSIKNFAWYPPFFMLSLLRTVDLISCFLRRCSH